MLTLKFMGVKPLSTNNLYSIGLRNGKKQTIPTKDYKVFKKEVGFFMAGYQHKLNKYFKNYDVTKHTIKATYHFYFPKDKIVNKNGSVKNRRNDADNFFKPINDQIFKYTDYVDDAFIWDIVGKKRVSEDGLYSYKIDFEILNKPYD